MGVYAYDGWHYVYGQGTRLVEMWKEDPETQEEIFHTFTYNADGMRIQRTCDENGRVYNYVYDGSLLTQMTVGGNVLRFTYDANGTPLTVIYEDITYYYVVNLQGDIVAILDSTGTKIVSYTYDAWGNILTTTGSMAQTLGSLNPLRYRGYVYDTETGLYYLQSRYYNPQWGRFITADCFVSTGQGVLGYNMFAYCLNNPIIRVDKTGEKAIYVTDYTFDYGLPIVGHTRLYLQDENGEWYATEYTGDKKPNANVYVYPANEEDVQKFLDNKRVFAMRYTVIEGDFSSSLELARNYQNTDYGGYNFFTNNCNHYAKEILTAGDFEDSTVQSVSEAAPGLVPRAYRKALDVADTLKKLWKELWKYV